MCFVFLTLLLWCHRTVLFISCYEAENTKFAQKPRTAASSGAWPASSSLSDCKYRETLDLNIKRLLRSESVISKCLFFRWFQTMVWTLLFGQHNTQKAQGLSQRSEKVPPCQQCWWQILQQTLHSIRSEICFHALNVSSWPQYKWLIVRRDLCSFQTRAASITVTVKQCSFSAFFLKIPAHC